MWDAVGHDRAVAALQRGLDSDRVSHSFLIAGPPQVGKTTLALDIARAVNCESDDRPCSECGQCRRISSGMHPDVRIVGLEKARSGRLRTLISIEQVRDVQREISLLPFEGHYRVIVFENAELFSEEAANSLLKTLEEPPERVLIVLVATDTRAMLPTIVSRCRLVQLRPVPAAAITDLLVERKGVSPDQAREIAGLASGRAGWAVQAAEDPDMLKRVSDVPWTRSRQSSEIRLQRDSTTQPPWPIASREIADQSIPSWSCGSPGGGTCCWSDRRSLNWSQTWAGSNHSLRRRPSLPPTSVTSAIKTVMRTTFLLERNVSPRLALEGMMLKLPAV